MVHHLYLLAVCVAGSIGVTLNVLVLLLLLHEWGGSISIVVPRLMKQIVFVHIGGSHAGFLLDLNLGRLREENLFIFPILSLIFQEIYLEWNYTCII